MTFAQRFRWNVSLLYSQGIPISMGSRSGESALLELCDGALRVTSGGDTALFTGSREEQAEAAIKNFGWQ
jgi:hypothetical protein